jgi:dCTP deaminase
MLKSSAWILEQGRQARMIEPFCDHAVREGVVSYGLGPYGYDLRLDAGYRIRRVGDQPLDPHRSSDEEWESCRDDVILLPPGRFILGRSLEYIRMPDQILGLGFGKSTYARCGVLVNITPLEPGWHGFLTISIANTGSVPVRLYANQGIAQLVFIAGDAPPLFSYSQLKGKYHEQDDIAIARIQKP